MYLFEGDVIDDQTLGIQPLAIVELIVSRGIYKEGRRSICITLRSNRLHT
jgi:hypothetical protein